MKIYENINKDLSWIKKHTIFLTIHGSIAYGLNTADSDIDIRGICTVPQDYLLGFNKNFNEFIKNDPDCTVFNIIKFFKLTSAGNPNTLELLFVNPEDHLHVDLLGWKLLQNRDKFLSKQLKERYVGYAKAQAHRIKQHRSWLLNPLDKKPERIDFGLPEKPSIEKNQFEAIKSLINKKIETWNPDFEPFSDSQKIYLKGKVSDILTEINVSLDTKWELSAKHLGCDDNLIYILKKEKEYENKIEEYKNYQNWKKNRNTKRSALEAKSGYDSKHACQLARLLIQGKEILDTGKVNVKRIEDREMLMEIKRGEWSYDKLIEFTDKIENEVKESYKNSKLPNQPDILSLDKLCISLLEQANSKFSWYNINRFLKGSFEKISKPSDYM